MTDTVFIEINPDTWTAVTTTTAGYISNASDTDIRFVEAATAPAASVIQGNTLRPRDRFTYGTLGAGQELYARSARANSFVADTPA